MVFKKRDYDKEAKAHITTSVKNSIHKLAQDNKIAWNEALEFGIKFLIADSDGGLTYSYPQNRLQEKLQRTLNNLNQKCLEIEELKNPQEKKVTDDIINKEFEEALGDGAFTRG